METVIATEEQLYMLHFSVNRKREWYVVSWYHDSSEDFLNKRVDLTFNLQTLDAP